MLGRNIVRRAVLLIVPLAATGYAAGLFATEGKAGNTIVVEVKPGGCVTITISCAPAEEPRKTATAGSATRPIARASATEAPGRAKAAPGGLPRELALRPLPAYRIDPPDVLQIQITGSKGGRRIEIPAPPLPQGGGANCWRQPQRVRQRNGDPRWLGHLFRPNSGSRQRDAQHADRRSREPADDRPNRSRR